MLIITDDQGYGDFGFHGNPIIRTPRLDRLASESAELTNFCVSPVCTPTRASLMTGRWNYRTRAIDTFRGRAMMDPAEVTIAEMLKDAGYHTGIFGKWHLGDHYPLRAMDQGFDESLVLFGGGLVQPADPPKGNSYFDPTLARDGRLVKTKGYCSDVYTDAALEFIRKQAAAPFFVYLAFNCPHDPLQVQESDLAPYRSVDMSPASFPAKGNPLKMPKPEDTAKLYGMVSNIDYNIGRVLDQLEASKLADDTIVVFLDDNGPAFPRYVAGLRGTKGTVFEGGIRSPCLVRARGIKPGSKVPLPSAHIDLLPTLLEACGQASPSDVKLDGRSVWAQLHGAPPDALPERTLFFQWHRGDVPQLDRAYTARGPRWKLLQANGVPPGPVRPSPVTQLFDLETDPYEEHDVASSNPEIVAKLHKEYEAWFADVSASRGYAPPKIVLGTTHENPTMLTLQDYRSPETPGWQGPGGHWDVDLATVGNYRFRLLFAAGDKPGKATLKVGGHTLEQAVASGDTECIFEAHGLPEGATLIEPAVTAGKPLAIKYCEVLALDVAKGP